MKSNDFRRKVMSISLDKNINDNISLRIDVYCMKEPTPIIKQPSKGVNKIHINKTKFKDLYQLIDHDIHKHPKQLNPFLKYMKYKIPSSIKQIPSQTKPSKPSFLAQSIYSSRLVTSASTTRQMLSAKIKAELNSNDQKQSNENKVKPFHKKNHSVQYFYNPTKDTEYSPCLTYAKPVIETKPIYSYYTQNNKEEENRNPLRNWFDKEKRKYQDSYYQEKSSNIKNLVQQTDNNELILCNKYLNKHTRNRGSRPVSKKKEELYKNKIGHLTDRLFTEKTESSFYGIKHFKTQSNISNDTYRKNTQLIKYDNIFHRRSKFKD